MTTRLQAEAVLDVGAGHLEGPLWDDGDDSLLFVDMFAPLVHRYRPSSGRHTSFDTGEIVGTVALDPEGGLVLALAGGFARCDAEGHGITPVAGFAVDTSAVRFNDGKVDPLGRLVAGTMDWNERDPLGALYALGRDGVETLLEHVTISNGLDWSADGSTMFYVDSKAGGIDAFDVDSATGRLSGARRIIATPPGTAIFDGMAIDAEGGLWVAMWGGGRVLRFGPDHELDAEIELPVANVTSVAFGGEDLSELFITTSTSGRTPEQLAAEPLAGHLFRARPGVRGVPTRRFGIG